MRVRKKPIVVDAELYRPGLEDGFSCIIYVQQCEWMNSEGKFKQCKECEADILRKPYIETLEGNMYIDIGDYIMTGIQGERYPCKPDIFLKTYDILGE